MTVVYVDLLFLLNLIANYLLLLGSGRITGTPLKRLRILLGAGVGAIYAVAVFVPGMEWMSAWPCKGAVGILMVLAAFGGYPELLRVSIVFFAASAALAGLVLGMELMEGTSLTVRNGVFYSSMDIRLLLLLFVLCYFVLSLVFRRMGRHVARDLIGLEFELEGERVSLTALKDSGHTLTDPITNQTVIVADFRFVSAALPDFVKPSDPIGSMRACSVMGMKGVRLIPYRTVGVDCGMLLAIRANAVKANGKGIGDHLVALSPNPVDDGGGYQALIGGELM